MKANDLQDHLQKKQHLLPSKLEGALVDMSRSLLALFAAAYCAADTVKGPSISIHHAKTLYRIQEMVQNELKNYRGFLSVKGERNVTMTRYPFFVLKNCMNGRNIKPRGNIYCDVSYKINFPSEKLFYSSHHNICFPKFNFSFSPP